MASQLNISIEEDVSSVLINEVRFRAEIYRNMMNDHILEPTGEAILNTLTELLAINDGDMNSSWKWSFDKLFHADDERGDQECI